MYVLLFIRTFLIMLLIGAIAFMLGVAYQNYAGYLSDPTGFKPSPTLRLSSMPSAMPSDIPQGLFAKAMSTPCPQEDSVNCYWNAESSGNGVGHSFYAIKFPHRTCVIYWQPTRNTHNYCERD